VAGPVAIVPDDAVTAVELQLQCVFPLLDSRQLVARSKTRHFLFRATIWPGNTHPVCLADVIYPFFVFEVFEK
jgi:hypothetical protein